MSNALEVGARPFIQDKEGNVRREKGSKKVTSEKKREGLVLRPRFGNYKRILNSRGLIIVYSIEDQSPTIQYTFAFHAFMHHQV